MKALVVAILTILLVACQSLPSAGLIYGTKRVVGVGIEKDASGNPIPGFNLGFVSHDFARVPVAVAPEPGGPVELIWGSSCQSDLSLCLALGGHERLFVLRIDKIAEALGKTVQAILGALANSDRKLLASTASIAVFEAPAEGDDAKALTDARASFSSAVTRLNVTSTAAADVIANNTSVRSATDVMRQDAFSVFGSFDTRAKSAEASIGQVFATGVAAQIVSTAAGDLASATRVNAARECLDLANKLTEATDKTNAIKTCLAANGGQ